MLETPISTDRGTQQIAIQAKKTKEETLYESSLQSIISNWL